MNHLFWVYDKCIKEVDFPSLLLRSTCLYTFCGSFWNPLAWGFPWGVTGVRLASVLFPSGIFPPSSQVLGFPWQQWNQKKPFWLFTRTDQLQHASLEVPNAWGKKCLPDCCSRFSPSSFQFLLPLKSCKGHGYSPPHFSCVFPGDLLTIHSAR